MIRVGVAGAAGRMGSAACRAVEAASDLELAGRADPQLDTDLEEIIGGCDVVVELSTPGTALDNAVSCLRRGVHVVVGATGFDADRLRAESERSGSGARCFVAPNFAIGAVLMMSLARQVAPHMPECEIVELHHDGKADAPSGTAARTAELVDEAGGHVHRPLHSVRLPGLVAHQEVIFGGPGQTLSIRHDSVDRESFMPGVLLAVRRVGELPDPYTEGLERLL